jgi:hypothetical protein
MAGRTSRGTLLVLVALVGVIAVASGPTVRLARRVARAYSGNTQCCMVPPARNAWLSLREALGVGRYNGQFGQDKWIAETAFPGVSDGFFVDVGSADGTESSNTKALEALGWTGVCVDPFPTNMAGRTCRMFREVVAEVTGRVVSFKAAGTLGGIAETLDAWKNYGRVVESPDVTFTTVSLADLLARAKAPAYIHYLSLDIEGAELAALRGFPFDKYSVGAMTIEHNNEEPKRSDILKFLAARGYVRVHSSGVDDFYQPSRR